MFSRLPEAFALVGLIKRFWKDSFDDKVLPDPPFKVRSTSEGGIRISFGLAHTQGESSEDWLVFSTLLVNTVGSIDVECAQVRNLTSIERRGLAHANLMYIWRELDYVGAVSHANGLYVLHDLILAAKVIESSVPRLLIPILRLKKRNSAVPL